MNRTAPALASTPPAAPGSSGPASYLRVGLVLVLWMIFTGLVSARYVAFALARS